MIKLNKNQKQKLKNNIFKVLHVLGYISMGLLVVIFTLVGVQNCHPKTQDHEVSLKIPYRNANEEKRSDEGTLYIPWANGYRTRATYNYDTFYNINNDGSIINLQYSIYHVDKQAIMDVTDSECFFYDGDNQSTFSYVDCIRFDKSTGNYVTNFGYFVSSLWFYNGSIYGRLDTTNPVKYIEISDNYEYMIIIRNYCLIKNDNKVGLYNMFEGVLVNTGTLTLDFVQNNLSALNYNDSLTFINEYWYRSYFDSYAWPLLLPNGELYANNSKSYCPLSYYNTYSLLGRSLQFSTTNQYFQIDGVNFKAFGDSITLSDKNYSSLYIPSSTNPSFYLDNDYCSKYFGVGFKVYGGCYKFHNLFQNFIRYSFKIPSFVDWSNGNVIFNVGFRFTPQVITSSDNNGLISVFNDARFNYNGSIFTDFSYRGDNFTYSSALMSVTDNVGRDLGSSYSFTTLVFRSGRYYDFNRVFQLNGNLLELTNFSLDTALIDDGFSVGGYDGGVSSVFSLLSAAFGSLAQILNVSIFGAFTIGSLMFLPLVVIIVLFIIKLFKR